MGCGVKPSARSMERERAPPGMGAGAPSHEGAVRDAAPASFSLDDQAGLRREECIILTPSIPHLARTRTPFFPTHPGTSTTVVCESAAGADRCGHSMYVRGRCPAAFRVKAGQPPSS